MPISSEKGKSVIKDWFAEQTDIDTIVDLGPGTGTYPKLLGNKYTFKAVEIWGPYVEKFNLKKYYQEIRIGDIQYMDLPGGDCAILGDVLEHLPVESAIKTFKKVNRLYRHVVISIPLNSALHKYDNDSSGVAFFINNIEKENRFEKHLSVWTKEELDKLIPSSYKVRIVVDPIAIFIR